ncbi:MAG: rubrerythrin family protein [Candidatus Lokiarchaeota archaeon]
MTTIIQNLKEAIIGEYTAQRKYELFSKVAIKDKQPMIAKLYKAISLAEAIHIKNHLRALEKITNKKFNIDEIVSSDGFELSIYTQSTRHNLINAISGETYEFKKMYKEFFKYAKKKDMYLAEFSFDLARKAEKVHSELFRKYLKLLDSRNNVNEMYVLTAIMISNFLRKFSFKDGLAY